MVERVVGQLTLADGLVAAEETVLDQIAEAVSWGPIHALLGVRGGPGAGNASYPAEALLRCLLLGVWHGLSDPALEAQIRDRLSFRRFTGFSLGERTPDHSTLWRFREELAKDGLVERVFEEINRQLEEKELIIKRGTLVDASLVAARARPPSRPKDAEEPARPSADADARWGRKGSKSVFGYKIHIGVDQDHTLIRRMLLTDASVTDTGPADLLICGDEAAAYGDQAYYTHARHARLKQAGIKDRLMRRPNKHHPVLPPRLKRLNRLISRQRAAVETTFATWKRRMGLARVRYFGLAKVGGQMLMAAMAFNLRKAAVLTA